MHTQYTTRNRPERIAIDLRAHLATWLMVPAGLMAQPTLQSTDIANVGASFVYQQAQYLPLPNSGANQTWNLNSAILANELTFNWVAPGSTEGGSNFPGATVAVSPVTLFQLDQYFTITATEMNDIGTYIPFILTTCSNPITILKFPLAYGNTWTDTFTCLRDDSGLILYNITGTVSANADGYGTVITPDGTISNVIRVTLSINSVINGGGSNTVSIITAQYYYKPGAGSYVAYNYIETQTVNGTPSVGGSRLRWLAGNSIGMEELLNNAIGIEFAPNPANESTLINFTTQGHTTLDVYNDHGQLLQTMDLGNKAPGIHQELLDTRSLPTGLYTVVIRSANGDKGTKRLMVQ